MEASERGFNQPRIISKRHLAGWLAALPFVGASTCLAHPGHVEFGGAHLFSADHALASSVTSADPALALIVTLGALLAGGAAAQFGRRALRTEGKVSAAARWFSEIVLAMVTSTLLAGCSGGGGGGGGGGGPTKRPSAPAVRILHGALDIEPVRLNSPLQDFVTADFASDTAGYIRYPKGPQSFILERNNAPGLVVGSTTATVEDDTFYSLLLIGQANDENFRIVVLPEPAKRPEKSKAAVQLVHALIGAGGLVMNGAGTTAGPVSYGSSSGYVEVPAGPATISIATSTGKDVGTLTLNLAERGQVTILVTGNVKDGVIVKRIYDDLG